MLQVFKGASRLAALLFVVGASTAFADLYTFDITGDARTGIGGSILISSNEDVNVQIELTALATSQNNPSIVVLTPIGAGVDDGQGGGNAGEDDIEGGARAETLVITPILPGGAPFTAVVDSVTFTNTEAANGGDEAAIFLDQISNTPDHIQNISDASGTFLWDPQANGDPDTFTTFIAFDNSDGNDDYRVRQIVLDITVGEIPEPSTWTLFGLGIAGLAYMRRRKKA